MHAPTSLPTGAELRRLLHDAYATVRATVRRIGGAATRSLDHVTGAAERYVGAKLERRVKPPIVAALAIAGVALVVALIAVVRK